LAQFLNAYQKQNRVQVSGPFSHNGFQPVQQHLPLAL
jgi:hypothetical protein